MLNDETKGRLYNCKFQKARLYLDDKVTEEEHDVINALARTFGDVGWLDGNMDVLVSYIVSQLIGPDWAE